ncbi:caveolin-2-like [Scyliorhinus torazame]|uniref:caveolin-2-like n=1 Tax=Scyliorhinus torazame TaxID=75743 RepID=UPI003B59ECB1
MGMETGAMESGLKFEDDFGNAARLLPGREEREEREPHRDPRGINTQLQVPFEDVIAEPAGTQSLDSTWICSHVSFEFFKFVLYKVLTLVLAIPLAFVIGILFAIITYIHIWFLMPIVKTFMMMQPTFSIIWKTLMDVFISPLYQSVGLRFSAANIRFARV